MSCRCGGSLRPQSNTIKKFDLEFQTCAACGRSGFWSLFDASGRLVAQDAAAQRMFLDMQIKATPSAPGLKAAEPAQEMLI